MNDINRAYLLYSEALHTYLSIVDKSWSTNEPRIRRAREAAWQRFSRRYDAFIEG
uniref:Uncharacterized protein n=1 Tax=viral metagenome TaxID=1070528 RepID=A0A6M3LW07_9ZZZZ